MNGRHVTTPLLLVATVTALAGCIPQAATSEGRSVAELYGWFVLLATVVAVVVWVPLTWAVLRYRRARPPSEAETEPPQIHGHLGLELLWTAGPAVTIVALFVLAMLSLGIVEARAPQPATHVEVAAFRWGWRFTYPAEDISVVGTGVPGPGPEVVLPVGEPVSLTLTGEDVVHAFYVPQFLVKHDAVPGRQTTFGITIERPGTYAGQCAEFCGLLHARMPFTIRAVPVDEFRAWVAAQQVAARQDAQP